MTTDPRTATAPMPTRSRSWENLVPHIDLGQGVRARHIQIDMERADVEELQQRMERDRASGHDEIVSYLDFKHLLRIFETDRALRMELGPYGSNKWNSMTRPLGELRNEVMHPVTMLVGTVDDMRGLTRDLANATVLVEKAIVALRKKYPATPR